MPKPILVNHSPHPVDPVKESRARIEAQRVEGPFVQQVRQQMALLEGETHRLETQIETLTQQCQDRRYQLQHLAAYLAVAVQEKG